MTTQKLTVHGEELKTNCITCTFYDPERNVCTDWSQGNTSAHVEKPRTLKMCHLFDSANYEKKIFTFLRNENLSLKCAVDTILNEVRETLDRIEKEINQ